MRPQNRQQASKGRKVPDNQIFIPSAYEISSEVISEAPKTLSYLSATSKTRSSAMADSISNLMIDVDDSVSTRYLSLKP